MEKVFAEKNKISIMVPGVNEEFKVEGFAEAYEAFIRESPFPQGQSYPSGVLLVVIGGITTMVGLLTFIFGPARFATESNLISLVGVLLSMVGGRACSNEMKISPEKFLCNEYELVGGEGSVLGGYESFKHLGDGKFSVVQ